METAVTMKKEQVIRAIKEMLRDHHAKCAVFKIAYAVVDGRKFGYDELHLVNSYENGGKLFTYVFEVFEDGHELEHGMREISTIPGAVIAYMFNKLKDNRCKWH